MERYFKPNVNLPSPQSDRALGQIASKLERNSSCIWKMALKICANHIDELIEAEKNKLTEVEKRRL